MLAIHRFVEPAVGTVNSVIIVSVIAAFCVGSHVMFYAEQRARRSGSMLVRLPFLVTTPLYIWALGQKFGWWDTDLVWRAAVFKNVPLILFLAMVIIGTRYVRAESERRRRVQSAYPHGVGPEV